MNRVSIITLLLIASLILGSIPATGTTTPAPDSASPTVVDGPRSLCSVGDSLNNSERRCLINTYSPVFHFHGDEEYRPTSVSAFVNQATVGGGPFEENVTVGDLPGEEDDLKLDSEAYTYRQSDLPGVVYSSVHAGAKFTPPGSVTSKEYIAVTYWTFYFYDNKALMRDDTGGEVITRFNPEKHQSDFESVTILINSSGPQWVGASQHLGGEIRPWGAVRKEEETHPHLYVAEGAHSLYFTNTGEYGSRGIFGQKQHLDEQSDSTQVVQGWLTSVNPSVAAQSSLVYTDVTGNHSSWSQNGVGPDNDWSREHYKVILLTGQEPWQKYKGSFIDSELSKRFIGKADPPAQRERWDAPGEWMENRLVYYDTQVVPKLGWQFHGVDKGGFNESTATVKITLRNDGAQPGTLYTRVTITDSNGAAIGKTVQEVKREAGTTLMGGQETISVDLETEPSDKVNFSVEVFTSRPEEGDTPRSTLSAEICSDRLKCLW